MNKLENLRYDLEGIFIDASGSPEGADELFNEIVETSEQRIIKLLERIKGNEKACCADCQPYQDIHRQYITLIIDMIQGDNK